MRIILSIDDTTPETHRQLAAEAGIDAAFKQLDHPDWSDGAIVTFAYPKVCKVVCSTRHTKTGLSVRVWTEEIGGES